MSTRRSSGFPRCLVAAVLLASLTACVSTQTPEPASEREGATAARPIRYKRVTGVPFLMDIPILGIFFRSTTVVR